jgi:sterol desaturase/sphingolipid hydroxylase (fatty acid hydroxylase superfamily)
MFDFFQIFLSKMTKYILYIGSFDYWMNAVVYTIFIALTSILIELYCVGFVNSSLRKILKPTKEATIDLVIYLLRFIKIYDIIGVVFTLGIGRLLIMYANAYEHSLPKISSGYVAVDALIYFIFFDFMCYVAHFLNHKSKLLFALHAFHHSAKEFNVLNNLRTHPVEAVINNTIIYLPLILFTSVTLEGAFLYATLSKIHSDLYHSGIASNWGMIGRYILISPAAHRIHHSDRSEHFGKNLGNHLIFWDNIFGTAVHVSTLESAQLRFRLVDYFDDSNKIFGCLKNIIFLLRSK